MQSAEEAYEDVLADVGCNVPTLDEHDQRVIEETRSGSAAYKGSISGLAGLPDTQDDVGGWEEYPQVHRPDDWDTDLDGLPNEWETAHGLNPNSPADDFSDANADADGDGYTNLEEYLNEIAAWPAPAAIVFNGATNTRYAQITNWDVNSDPTRTHNWQPAKFDAAHLRTGTTVVDAVGQHAGTLVVAAARSFHPNAARKGIDGTLSIGTDRVGARSDTVSALPATCARGRWAGRSSSPAR